MFEKQHLWAMHNNEKPELLRDFLAVIPQLDIEKLKKDSSNPNIDKLIDIDKSDATNLAVKGTPTIFDKEGKNIVWVNLLEKFGIEVK